MFWLRSFEFHDGEALELLMTERLQWQWIHIFFHVACFSYIRDDYMCLQCRNLNLDTAICTKPFGSSKLSVSGCVRSQNLAWPREISKINSRKIVGIPKSQDPLLANNSNNKVPFFLTRYRATGNFVISTGFFISQTRVYKSQYTSAQKHGFVSEPALKLLGRWRLFTSWPPHCDQLRATWSSLPCCASLFCSDFDHDGELLMTERLQYSGFHFLCSFFLFEKINHPLVRFSSNFQESFVMVSFIPHCMNEILSAKK